MQIEMDSNRDFLPAFRFLADASFTGIKSTTSALTEPFFRGLRYIGIKKLFSKQV